MLEGMPAGREGQAAVAVGEADVGKEKLYLMVR